MSKLPCAVWPSEKNSVQLTHVYPSVARQELVRQVDFHPGQTSPAKIGQQGQAAAWPDMALASRGISHFSKDTIKAYFPRFMNIFVPPAQSRTLPGLFLPVVSDRLRQQANFLLASHIVVQKLRNEVTLDLLATQAKVKERKREKR